MTQVLSEPVETWDKGRFKLRALNGNMLPAVYRHYADATDHAYEVIFEVKLGFFDVMKSYEPSDPETWFVAGSIGWSKDDGRPIYTFEYPVGEM